MSSQFKKALTFFAIFLFMGAVLHVSAAAPLSKFRIDASGLPILGIGSLLTFMVRLIFIVAGLAALFYGLLGGLAWIMSGGGKDEIGAARDKIMAAIVGIFVLIVVLTVIWTLEQVVFKGAICFGISCDIRIPGLDITPLPAETCSQLCQQLDGNNYTDGFCRPVENSTIGGVVVPHPCDAGDASHARGDLYNPSKPGETTECGKGLPPSDGQCCCIPNLIPDR